MEILYLSQLLVRSNEWWKLDNKLNKAIKNHTFVYIEMQQARENEINGRPE